MMRKGGTGRMVIEKNRGGKRGYKGVWARFPV